MTLRGVWVPGARTASSALFGRLRDVADELREVVGKRVDPDQLSRRTT